MKRLFLFLSIGITFQAIAQPNCNENQFDGNVTYNFVSDNSGNTYRTVLIGGREWFAENLRAFRYLNGDTITEVSSLNPDENLLKNGAWSFYADSAQLDCSRGKLYNFYTIVDERGLCPSGFRVPSFYDWEQLIQAIGGPASGLELMEVGNSHWSNPNPAATNSTGFTAVPGGGIDGNGDFGGFDQDSYLWTSSFGTNTINQYTSQNFFTKRLGSIDGYLYQLGDPTFRNLHSIRCVRVDTLVNHTPVLSPLVIDSVGLYSLYITSDISNDGGLSLRVRGIVVGPDSTVTLNTSHRIMDGSNLGSVSSVLTNLEPNTTYYARLYAGNDDEIVFGEPVQFTTQAVQISLPSYIPASGNKGYWPFNGNANDESGNQRHGVVYGPQLTADRFGNPASAYQFDTLLYITTSFNNLNSPSMTLASWARSSSAEPGQTIASTSEGYSGLFFNSDQITATFSTGGGFQNGDYPNSGCNDGNWHHVAMSYNDTTIRIYLDGEMVVDGPISFDLLFGGTLDFGRHNPFGRYFYGELDDIGLWDRALNPQEIYQLYQAQCSLNVSLNAGSATPYCQGDTVALLASTNGISQYEWSRDGQFILAATDSVFHATQSGTYSVKALSGVCLAYDTLTISINSLPSVNAGSDQNVCAGSSIILAGGGATSYTWDNGVQNGVAFTPASTGSYVLTGTDANGCTNNDTLVVTVNMLPTVDAGSDQVVCMGSSVTISGNGAIIYTWDNGVQNGIPFIASVSTNYVVSGTDANGCSNTDTVMITTNPLPSVNAGTDQVVCQGTSVTLSGNSTVPSSWDNGIQDGVAFLPSNTTNYIFTGIAASGCVNSDTVLVTVNMLPPVNAGSDQNICIGSPTTLTGSGATTYTWDNGVQDGVPFIPSAMISVIVIGTDLNGCTNQDTVDVNVADFTSPLVSTTPSDPGSCNGTGTVQTDPSGSFSISWSNGFDGSVVNGLCAGVVSVVVAETTFGCVYQAYGLVEENGTSYPLSTQISLNDASVDGLCDGTAEFFAYGGVSPYTYELFDANYSLIGSNPSISGLCSGLYKIYISDSQGTIDSTSFYIADPGNVYSSDPYADSSIIDTLFVDLIEDCIIDFETIDTVWVSQITYPNADTAIVTWAIQDINGIHYIDLGYAITNLLGTFAVELVLFCPGKAPGDPFFKLYSQVYINPQTLNSGGGISSSGRIILFPNPADDLITLLMDEARHEMYILSDSQGRTVLKGWLSGTQTQISIRELKSGTYVLQIGEDKMPIRVIKQ